MLKTIWLLTKEPHSGTSCFKHSEHIGREAGVGMLYVQVAPDAGCLKSNRAVHVRGEDQLKWQFHEIWHNIQEQSEEHKMPVDHSSVMLVTEGKRGREGGRGEGRGGGGGRERERHRERETQRERERERQTDRQTDRQRVVGRTCWLTFLRRMFPTSLRC